MDLMTRGFGFDNLFDTLLPETVHFNEMKCDIYEKDDKYHLEMDIPGMKKDNITIECEDGYLSIIASGEKDHEDKDKKYVRHERQYGKYQRRFYVGKIDPAEIKAEFKDGSLFVEFPKETQNTNKYEVEVK